MGSGITPSYRHSIPVRYGEVDSQGVVFNAHYLAYCDDAADTWWREVLGPFELTGWEPMVVKAVIEWEGSAGIGDTMVVTADISRWGTTSFDVAFAGFVAEAPTRAVFTATVTYVGVDGSTKKPKPPPDAVRRALGG